MIWCKRCLFLVEKGFITVKWCDFLNVPDCSRCCCFFCLFVFKLSLPTYPHYWWLFIKKSHCVHSLWNHQQSSNTVSMLRYLAKNIVIFTHFITFAAPTPRIHNMLSVTTYMISDYQCRLIWTFTIVIRFSALSPRPMQTQKTKAKTDIAWCWKQLVDRPPLGTGPGP